MTWKMGGSVVVLAGLALTLLAGDGAAREPAPGRKAAGAFQVYGGQCSRSWRLLGTYKDANSACNAARRLRTGKLRVQVMTGTHGKYPWSAPVSSYSVQARSCKTFNHYGSSGFFWQTALLASVARQQRNDVEIVYHYDAR